SGAGRRRPSPHTYAARTAGAAARTERRGSGAPAASAKSATTKSTCARRTGRSGGEPGATETRIAATWAPTAASAGDHAEGRLPSSTNDATPQSASVAAAARAADGHGARDATRTKTQTARRARPREAVCTKEAPARRPANVAATTSAASASVSKVSGGTTRP